MSQQQTEMSGVLNLADVNLSEINKDTSLKNLPKTLGDSVDRMVAEKYPNDTARQQVAKQIAGILILLYMQDYSFEGNKENIDTAKFLYDDGSGVLKFPPIEVRGVLDKNVIVKMSDLESYEFPKWHFFTKSYNVLGDGEKYTEMDKKLNSINQYFAQLAKHNLEILNKSNQLSAGRQTIRDILYSDISLFSKVRRGIMRVFTKLFGLSVALPPHLRDEYLTSQAIESAKQKYNTKMPSTDRIEEQKRLMQPRSLGFANGLFYVFSAILILESVVIGILLLTGVLAPGMSGIIYAACFAGIIGFKLIVEAILHSRPEAKQAGRNIDATIAKLNDLYVTNEIKINAGVKVVNQLVLPNNQPNKLQEFRMQDIAYKTQQSPFKQASSQIAVVKLEPRSNLEKQQDKKPTFDMKNFEDGRTSRLVSSNAEMQKPMLGREITKKIEAQKDKAILPKVSIKKG